MTGQVDRRVRAGSLACDLLNMGQTKYGDCIVVQFAGKSILIDGGHPGDYKDRDDRPSIPSQLETVLAHKPPFHFDLFRSSSRTVTRTT